MYKNLIKDLKKLSDPNRAKASARFFKTGPGQYGEGDIFIGVKVPDIRKVIRSYREMPLTEAKELLKSPIHEYRFAALQILRWQFEHADAKQQERIYKFYMRSTKYVNNWDLVDTSAPYIVGQYLLNQKDRSDLYRFARASDLWKQRIAIISTMSFIAKKDFTDALQITEILLNHEHDLIHKAVGWMLREVGNQDRKVEETFLQKHYKQMPRTMLRYAIEKFPEPLRKRYLKGQI